MKFYYRGKLGKFWYDTKYWKISKGKKNGTGYYLEGFLDRSGDSAVRMREQNIMI